MPAIITDNIKRQFIDTLYNENADSSSNRYYIAIGKSETWDSADAVPTPANTERNQKLFRYGIQSVKKVDILGASYVVPRSNWSTGTIYSQFNDNITGQPSQSYYVITDDNNVYICLRQGKDTTGAAVVSTVKPTGTSPSSIISTADGYVWKYLYTITTANANKFLSANYIPVEYIDSALSTEAFYAQYLVHNAASPKQIAGYRVTSGGSGYTSDPVVTVRGNGTNAFARTVVNTSLATIAAVEFKDSANALGTGYDYATVTLTGGGGSGATVVPVFGPVNGFGYDPVKDLRASAIMFNAKIAGAENDDFIISNDFRQVGLIRNIKKYSVDSDFTDDTGIALKKMRFTSLPGVGAIDFDGDILITATTGTPQAKALIDYYDDSNTVWYHQNETTGFTPFTDGISVNIEGYGSTLTTDSAAVNPDVNIFSGDLLYIDNRTTAIVRNANQTEDIKLIIQL